MTSVLGSTAEWHGSFLFTLRELGPHHLLLSSSMHLRLSHRDTPLPLSYSGLESSCWILNRWTSDQNIWEKASWKIIMIDYSLLLIKPGIWQAGRTQKEDNQQFQNPIKKNCLAVLHVIPEDHPPQIMMAGFGGTSWGSTNYNKVNSRKRRNSGRLPFVGHQELMSAGVIAELQVRTFTGWSLGQTGWSVIFNPIKIGFFFFLSLNTNILRIVHIYLYCYNVLFYFNFQWWTGGNSGCCIYLKSEKL